MKALGELRSSGAVAGLIKRMACSVVAALGFTMMSGEAAALPDLSVTVAEGLSTHVHQGRPLTVHVEISNLSADTAGAFDVEILLSDTLGSTTGRLLSTVSVSGVAGQEAEAFSQNVTIPLDQEPGNAYLIVSANGNQSVLESDYGNNLAFAQPFLKIGGAAYQRSEVSSTFQTIVGESGTIQPNCGPTLPVALPFPFTYFGKAVSHITCSEKGWIQFGDPRILPSRRGPFQSEPILTSVNGLSLTNAIQPLWGGNEYDFSIPTSGLYSRVTGAPGQRVVTYEFSDLRAQIFASIMGSLSMQVRLHEASGRVEIQYDGPRVTDYASGIFTAGNSVTGIVNADKSEAYAGLDFRARPEQIPAATIIFDPVVFSGVELELLDFALRPSRVPAGATTAARLTVVNRGDTATPSFRIGVYEDLGSGQRGALLGQRFVDPMLAGEEREIDVIARAPSGALGTTRLLAVVDDLGVIGETIEVSNARSADLDVSPAPSRPDLVSEVPGVRTISVPMGGSFSIPSQIRNQGSEPANNCRLQVLVSTDMVFDSSDGVALDAGPFSLMAGGAVLSQTLTATMPWGFTPGLYHVSILADSEDVLLERDERNNVSPSIPIQVLPAVGPELVPVSLTPIQPFTHLASGAMSFEVQVTNFGDVPAPAGSRIGFVAGNQPNSLFFSAWSAPSTMTLAPGGTRTEIVSGTLTSQRFQALYFAGAVTDAPSGDEPSNNVMGLDASRSEVTGIGFAFSGSSFPNLGVSGQVRLARNVVPPGGRVSLMSPHIRNASRTSISDYGDISLQLFTGSGGQLVPVAEFARQILPALDVNSTLAPFLIETRLDRSLAPGTYTIVSEAVVRFPSAEASAIDNRGPRFLAKLTIAEPPDGTDLAATALTTDRLSVDPGGVVQVTVDFENLLANPAEPFLAGIYLSLDGAIDGNDLLLEPLDFPGGLRATDPQSRTLTVAVPASVSGGPALIGVLLDAGDDVVEADESNNVRELSITINGPRSCDLNGDGRVDVVDVQRSINAALGLSTTGGREDVNGDGQVNVADVQRLINAALGGTCP